ncbi:MAG TPA: hypothetical protein VLL97_12720 [Acidobacteriota bacterium]|nr:hypothetical protein [Acidobacteriota bacterium]
MTIGKDVLQRPAPKLKSSSGWFAAGKSFRHAALTLPDGTFKVFAYIALEAERETGCPAITQTELARVLRKSRRAIGKYISELQQKRFCFVTPATNQHVPSIFEVADEYWPYEKGVPGNSTEDESFVAAVRDSFLKTGCTQGKFGSSDARTAKALRQRGVSLTLLQDAINLGACRKYASWFNCGPHEQIASLRYFEPLISELQRSPLPYGYSEHLKSKLQKLSQLWQEQGTGASVRKNSGSG